MVLTVMLITLPRNAAATLAQPVLSAPTSANPKSNIRLKVKPVAGATYYTFKENRIPIGSSQTPEFFYSSNQSSGRVSIRAQACNANGCGADSEAQPIYLSSGLLPALNVGYPQTGNINEPTCFTFAAKPDWTYTLYSGDEIRGQSSTSPLCYTPTTAAVETVHISGCNSDGICTYASEKRHIAILPKEEIENSPLISIQARVVDRTSGITVHTHIPENADTIKLFLNGRPFRETSENQIHFNQTSTTGIYSVSAQQCKDNVCGDLSQPIHFAKINTLTAPRFYPTQNILMKNSPINVYLNWSYTSGATRYLLRRTNLTSGHSKVLTHAKHNATTGHDYLLSYANYMYTIQACNQTYCSFESAPLELQFAPLAPNSPSSPDSLSISPSYTHEGQSVQLSFNSTNEDADVHYEIYENGTLVHTTSTQTYTFTAPPFGRYTYDVIACNFYACTLPITKVLKSRHDEINIEPLNATYFTDSIIGLNWNKPNHHTDFEVLRKINDGEYVRISDAKETFGSNATFNDSDTSILGRYCYKIQHSQTGVNVQVTSTSPVMCTSISERGKVESHRAITMVQYKPYTFSSSDVSIHNDDTVSYSVGRILPGQHYTVLEDGISIHSDNTYFGELKVPVVFKDQFGIETEPYTLTINKIDGRPKAIEQTITVTYPEQVMFSPYISAEADPLGLDIVDLTLVKHPSLGGFEIPDSKGSVIYDSSRLGRHCNVDKPVEDSFQITITNSAGVKSEVTTTTINVLCQLDPHPIATGDVLTYNENITSAHNIIDNPCNDHWPPNYAPPRDEMCARDDYDNYGLAVSLHDITQPPYFGQLFVVGNEVIYVPAKDTCQTDWFTYRASNEKGYISAPKLVRLECGPSIIAIPDAMHVVSGKASFLDVLANDTSIDNTPFSLGGIVTPPQYGTIEQSNNGFVYKSKPEKCDQIAYFEDVFTYENISNSGQKSAPAAVKLTVHCMTFMWEKDKVTAGEPVTLHWQIPLHLACQVVKQDIDEFQINLSQASGSVSAKQFSTGEYQFTLSCQSSAHSQSFHAHATLNVIKLPAPTFNQH